MAMILGEFQKKVEKEHQFYKFWNYIYVCSLLGLGFFLLYITLLTNWSDRLSKAMFIWVLVMSLYCLYQGINGFIHTPKIDNIHILSKSKNAEINRRNAITAAEKINLRMLPIDDPAVLYFETKNILLEKKDLWILANDEGIYAYIQQRNHNGPTFVGYRGSVKLIAKLRAEIKRLESEQPAISLPES